MTYKWFILVMLGFQAFRIVSYLGVRRKIHKRNKAAPPGYRDATILNLPPPQALIPLLEEARALGFTRLGEVEITGAVNNPPLRAWVLVDLRHHTTCDLNLQVNPELPPIGDFMTIADNGCVMTTFRMPRLYMFREIDEPDFRAWNVDESLTAAYEAHRQAVAQMQFRRNAIIERNTIQDYLRVGALYVEKYFPRRRTNRKLSNENPSVQVIIVAQFILCVALLTVALFMPYGTLTSALILVVILLPIAMQPLIRHLLRQF